MDRGVIATATELFDARHYPGVVAMCTDALEDEPACAPLLLIRARAHIALRRDLDAQADLRELIRLDSRCAIAYRLLGVLAARRDENESAAIFLREALRLQPDDREAADWLLVVEGSFRPAAVAQQFPAPAAAAGRFHPVRTATVALDEPAPRLARGTRPPDAHDERPTSPYAKHALPAAAAPARRPSTRLIARSSLPEPPGFGEYLVAAGILTRERLRAAQTYQRSMKVQLSTAIVTLGLATPQRIEWAAVAHRSQLARGAS